MTSGPWSVEQLTADLRRLGVRPGDRLMVHASLRAIGGSRGIAGGADGVLDALEAAVGPDGTLFMTLGARDDWGWVNERPEDERPGLLAAAEPFDRLATPADPDVGVLAEVFRTRPGTLVSDHPEGRFGAWGSLAEHLVDDVPWDDYYGPDSPLERFTTAGGRILRLGADLDTVTLLHYAEYRAPVPSKRRVRRHRMASRGGGPAQLVVVECLDDNAGIVDYPGEDYFAVILRRYLATGRASVGRVGDATSELIDGADLVDFGVAWMAEHFASPPGAGRVTPRRRGGHRGHRIPGPRPWPGAIRAGDQARLRQLLTRHPDWPGWRWWTAPAPDAPRCTSPPTGRDTFPGVASTIAALVEAGADVNARVGGPHAETALHWAASSDDVAALDALLDAGADIEADGAVIANGTPLSDAVAFGQWRRPAAWSNGGRRRRCGRRPPWAWSGRVEAACGSDPARRDPDDVNRAFWYASHGGQLAVARNLADRGADLDWVSPWDGLSPLDAARRSQADDLVAWLVARGHARADPR